MYRSNHRSLSFSFSIPKSPSLFSSVWDFGDQLWMKSTKSLFWVLVSRSASLVVFSPSMVLRSLSSTPPFVFCFVSGNFLNPCFIFRMGLDPIRTSFNSLDYERISLRLFLRFYDLSSGFPILSYCFVSFNMGFDHLINWPRDFIQWSEFYAFGYWDSVKILNFMMR